MPGSSSESEWQERYHDITAISDAVIEQALSLKHRTEELEECVHKRTVALHEANMEAIFMLAEASEAKDLDTGAHVRRIERYTRLLAGEMGLAGEELEQIAYSSILHDVGKISIPDAILRKPGPLSASEWETMKQHTIAGERILSRKPFFDIARSIARSHHENWDGTGYPDGLRATQIPQSARIVRVADVFDALTNARAYKLAWKVDRAAAEIEGSSQFDPQVVSAFRRLHRSGRLAEEAAKLGVGLFSESPFHQRTK